MPKGSSDRSIGSGRSRRSDAGGSSSAATDDADADADAAAAAAAAPLWSKLRVLIVEDDDLNVLVMRTCLQVGPRKHYAIDAIVTRACTAEEALAIIADAERCPSTR